MSLYDPTELQGDIYALQRLKTVRRAPDLTPSMAFDLAMSPLDDNELELALEDFGAPPDETGVGLADVFNEMVSRDPATVPLEDLSYIQANLVQQGYAPPDSIIGGPWNSTWDGYMRRLDRDATSEIYQGNHIGASSVERAMQVFANVMPVAVIKGIVGEAKGIIEQAPETAENLGVAGGAGAGAIIGASVGGPVGALAGGLLGGIIGGVADLVGDDEEEDPNRSAWAAALDVLSPIEEWSGPNGRQQFLEDIGFVATSALMLKGLGAAGTAVKGAASTVSQAGLAGSLTKTAVSAPGWAGRMTSWIIGNRGNQFKALSAFGNKTAAESFENWVKVNGLKALNNRPLLHDARSVFSSLTKAQFAGRYTAGLGGFEGETTIEKNIAAADAVKLPYETGIDAVASLFLYADGFLPFGKKMPGASNAAGMEAAADSLLGNRAFQPFLDAFGGEMIAGKVHSLRKQRSMVLEAMGDNDFERSLSAGWMRLNFGIERAAQQRVLKVRQSADNVDDFDTLLMDAKESIKADILNEGGISQSPIARELITSSYVHHGEFRSYLQGLPGQGNGLTRMKNYIAGEKEVQSIMQRVNRGEIEMSFPTPQTTAEMRGLESAYKNRISELRREGNKLKQTDNPDLTPAQLKAAKDEGQRMLKTATELQKDLARVVASRHKQGGILVLANLEDETRGLAGYQTKEDVIDMMNRFQFEQKKFVTLRRSWKRMRTKSDLRTNALIERRQTLTEMINEMEYKGLIQPHQVTHALDNLDGALDNSKPFTGKWADEIVEHLSGLKNKRAQAVELPEEEMAKLAKLGYRPVVRDGSVLTINDASDFARAAGLDLVGKYGRTRAVIDTLGFSPVKTNDDVIRRIMATNQKEALHAALVRNGIKMDGNTAMKRLRDYLNERNTPVLKRSTRQTTEAAGSIGPFNIRKEIGTSKLRPELFRVDVRDLRHEDIINALDLGRFKIDNPHEVADALTHALKKGAALGGEASIVRPIQSVRALGKALRLNGMPGYSDWVRTIAITPKSGAIGGAVLGGAYTYNATEGDELAALFGAGGGALLGKRMGSSQKGWNYLPDKLHKANLAMRYTLSATFDAGRYIEQNSLAQKYDLPFMVAPKKYISNTYGEQEWEGALRYWDEINGVNFGQAVDDLDRRMFQKGLLGFSPIYHEAAQAWILRKRWLQQGMSEAQIANKVKESVSEIGRYGLGRSAMEKSAHFVVFPFSFTKKLVTMLSDTIMQAPVRALLIHEGMRRYHESSLDEKMSAFLKENVPIAQNLARLNNFAYGVGPGRFFLEGMTDNQSVLGTAQQAITSVLVPGGSATPLAQATGDVGDYVANMFTPIVIVGEDLKSAPEILEAAVPLWKDVHNWARGLNEQKRVMIEGATKETQYDRYFDSKDELDQQWLSVALEAGYEDVDTFLASEAGAMFAPTYDAELQAIDAENPTAAKERATFTNKGVESALLIEDLKRKTDKTKSEEAILSIWEMIQSAREVASMMGQTQEGLLGAIQKDIRTLAFSHVEDKRFVDLWDEVFRDEFGPIRLKEAAVG